MPTSSNPFWVCSTFWKYGSARDETCWFTRVSSCPKKWLQSKMKYIWKIRQTLIGTLRPFQHVVLSFRPVKLFSVSPRLRSCSRPSLYLNSSYVLTHFRLYESIEPFWEAFICVPILAVVIASKLVSCNTLASWYSATRNFVNALKAFTADSFKSNCSFCVVAGRSTQYISSAHISSSSVAFYRHISPTSVLSVRYRFLKSCSIGFDFLLFKLAFVFQVEQCL